jgi:hypothetical protein
VVHATEEERFETGGGRKQRGLGAGVTYTEGIAITEKRRGRNRIE